MNIKLSYHWAVAAFLVITTGCSNEDIIPETKPNSVADNEKTTQVSFVAENVGTRTSLNYENGDFYWEDGDKIYVKDDDNTFHASSNAVSGTKIHHFKFMMSGKYANTEYLVYYPGKNGTNNQVTISASQTQNEPDNTLHFGVSGDCGTGKATRNQSGQYVFKLTHSAAYLCFKPNYDHPLASTYITKIEVISDDPIAGTYTLGTDGKLTGTGNANTITLNLTGTGNNSDGFFMQNNTQNTSCSTGRMFMVIAPGKHKLTVKYYIKDKKTNVSGIITKKFGEFEYGANDYYDISSALNIRHFNDDYYTWDAKAEYWAGYKGNQPKDEEGQGANYPTSADANRWFNPVSFPNAASNTAKNCPNANEIRWYCLKGAPHWDNTTLWSVWGYLYTGGMWFKKASVIASEAGKPNANALKNVAPNGRDYAKEYIYETPPNNPDVKHGVPQDRKNYFFLPAMGRYAKGKLDGFKSIGWYWTSTPLPYNKNVSYSLYFISSNVVVSNANERMNGFRLWTPE
ncbi:hypothetical protein [Prevotella intermedia]|uniref:hypothetical protein n=1 Tax=Prevotella intermedia TaxID=28131 RepID=UPI0020048814|nr:hypothetical protein [Prevotella intermedia]MCK6143603.1 hypothetical protein [Prevotella intermedia]